MLVRIRIGRMRGGGRRLQRLDPDPATAPWVRWIFEQRAAGRSVAGIARELNERGVACPSGVDRERNRHRSGVAWIVRTVVGILENPRYTGRQVWNRHNTTSVEDWVISDRPVHPRLVDDAMFAAVQGLRAARQTQDGLTRTYALAGLVRCGVCARRMDAHWVNSRPGYRCRHGHTSARTRSPGLAKNVYVREDRLLGGMRNRLSGLVEFDDVGVANHLRAEELVIVCASSSWTLEASAELTCTARKVIAARQTTCRSSLMTPPPTMYMATRYRRDRKHCSCVVATNAGLRSPITGRSDTRARLADCSAPASTERHQRALSCRTTCSDEFSSGTGSSSTPRRSPGPHRPRRIRRCSSLDQELRRR
jgi:hypothetical protein